MNRNRELQIRNAACELLEGTGSDFYNAISVNHLLQQYGYNICISLNNWKYEDELPKNK